MQILTILAIMGVFWLCMQRDDARDTRSERNHSRDRDNELKALKNRVTTLESILLDRDRQLRNRFGDL